MVELSESERKLVDIYKKLRIKEIQNKQKMKKDLTLTEKSVLVKETQEVEVELNKIKKHFSDLFYKKWLKEWDEQKSLD